jgi:hypothetical protein
MARIALVLPTSIEDRLAEEAVRHGHEIVARCASAHEFASRAESLGLPHRAGHRDERRCGSAGHRARNR